MVVVVVVVWWWWCGVVGFFILPIKEALQVVQLCSTLFNSGLWQHTAQFIGRRFAPARPNISVISNYLYFQFFHINGFYLLCSSDIETRTGLNTSSVAKHLESAYSVEELVQGQGHSHNLFSRSKEHRVHYINSRLYFKLQTLP